MPNDSTIPLAFGLSIAAGAASILGGFAPFFIKPTQLYILPYSLAFSSGVMLYVSFTEVYSEMSHHYHIAKQQGSLAIPHLGMAFCWVLVKVTSWISPDIEKLHPHDGGSHHHNHTSTNTSTTHHHDSILPADGNFIISNSSATLPGDLADSASHSEKVSIKVEEGLSQEQANRLIKLSMATRLLWGVATFISTVKSPSLGTAVAIAIGIHNIPEGICVAIPVYYATGSKLKALLWASVAAIAEPFGACIAYAVMQATLSPIGFALAFGLVAGIMLMVQAHRHTSGSITENRINAAFVLGMVVMAISISIVVE
ncbi:hypothetical protein BC829DRAFT_381766 [Chytridium lagenaria]|nr:hypothetical protein BC829DRAFT_381766 [Chytridium lagenaria]